MGTDDQATERVTYLASLVSNVHDVDPMLDTLRAITAQRMPDQELQLSPEERTRLQQLEAQLSDYLVNKDPVRAFTPESLQAKLTEHFKQADPRRQANRSAFRQLLTVLGLALVGYGAGLLFIPAEMKDRYALSAPALMLIIGIGIVWMFWKARSSLVPSMQKSFALFSVAVTVSSFGSAQYPFIATYPWIGDMPLFHYGGFIAPYVLMYGLFYVGFYQFARQLRQSRLVSILHPRWVGLAAVVLLAIGLLAPHPSTDFPLFFSISLACLLLNILFCGAATLLGLSAAKQITPRYATPVRLLALAIGSYFTVNCVLSGLLLFTGALNPSDPRVAGISSLYTVALVLELVSAYLLKRNIQE
jgi:hypothetical protein